MLARNVTGAAIVNIASIFGKGGFPGLSTYTASKGGVVAFTKAIAVELATRGIRVNAILPGLTNTPTIQKLLSMPLCSRPPAPLLRPPAACPVPTHLPAPCPNPGLAPVPAQINFDEDEADVNNSPPVVLSLIK
ncbi:hypothetical protein HPB47_013478 [Ixodes persulcatus]|uniref:Uncharacterized protein n=1 Tax=Ixodes persulcatus TaxID=34615 RepID=A0AC60QZ91_IXOPE|nr:hypothetical protein HPB47_013478 [Ixodes persulcatus]